MQSRSHKWNVPCNQVLVQVCRDLRHWVRFLAQCQAAQAKLLSVERIDGERGFELAEIFPARTENDRELIVAGSNIELVLVLKQLLIEVFQFLLFEFEMYGVAEARGFRAVGRVPEIVMEEIRAKLAALLGINRAP